MTKVKICGLSTAETMQAALDNGADMVGLVFFAKSPRNVAPEQAIKLAEMARNKTGVAVTALVVDADDAILDEIDEAFAPDFYQLHGHETPSRALAIKDRYGASIIKAIKIETAQDIEHAAPFKGIADIILFDAKEPKLLAGALPGGNGQSFDWWLLKNSNAGISNFMLAGGLTPANVGEAIKITRAPWVDVSSGVEYAPGIKDADLIAKFIKAAKSAANEDSL